MKCPSCGSTDLRKKGTRGNDRQRMKCNKCYKYFTVKKETKATVEMKVPEIVTWRDLTKVAKEHQKLRQDMSFDHTEARAKVDKDSIVLLPLADFHWGNEGTDYLFIESITDYVKQNNIYVVLIGDILDSFFIQFKNASVIFEQVMNPEEQLHFLESWLEEIEPYLLACTWDNHSTMRAEAIIGHDFFGKLQSRFAPFFSGIGKLNLQVKNVNYEIVLTHKGKGKSMYNALHSLQNIDRFLTECDIAMGGHYHNPAFGMMEIRGKNIYTIQTGTAEIQDLFSQRHFRFGQAQCSFPCLVLSGSEKRIIPFERVEDAVKFRDK